MPFSVSALCAGDIPTLAELERLCFSRPWSAAALAEELDNPAALFLVARTEDGTVAGYVGAHLAVPEAFMDNLAVFPAFRRQGAARLLLQNLREACAARGVNRLALEVRAGNGEAQRLYRACGFVQDGRRPGFYRQPAEDALLFSLTF